MEGGHSSTLKNLSISVIWKIKNFRLWRNNNIFPKSPGFYLGPTDNKLFCMLCIDGTDKLFVSLILLYPFDTFKEFFCRLVLLGDNEQILVSCEPRKHHSSDEVRAMITLGYFEDCTSFNDLTICCDLWTREPATPLFSDVPISPVLLYSIGWKYKDEGCFEAIYKENDIKFGFSFSDEGCVKIALSGTLKNVCVVSVRGEGELHDFSILNENFFEPSLSFVGYLEWLGSQRKLPKFFKNNSLLTCDVRLSFSDEITSSQQTQKSVTSGSFLKRDVFQLYRDRFLTDLCLNSGSKTFNVHSVILAARSPVFRQILYSDRTKQKDRTLDLSDLSSQATSQMLEYLYADDPGELTEEVAPELYHASDKYQIQELKETVSSFLAQNLSSSNVCDNLKLALRYNDTQLKVAIVHFILQHEKEVLSAEEFKAFSKKDPSMANELFKEIKKSTLKLPFVRKFLLRFVTFLVILEIISSLILTLSENSYFDF